MYNPFSSFPPIDHLIEGYHYTLVDWDFAEGCAPGEKMTFGVCRKVGDSQKAASEEELVGKKAQKEGSKVENNKAVTMGKKKYGWAMKGGKPVMVEWGSVAGEKKVGPKPPKPSKSPAPKSVQPSAPPKPAVALANPNASKADRQQAINEVGEKVLGTA
jgi:hypothetical protein